MEHIRKMITLLCKQVQCAIPMCMRKPYNKTTDVSDTLSDPFLLKNSQCQWFTTFAPKQSVRKFSLPEHPPNCNSTVLIAAIDGADWENTYQYRTMLIKHILITDTVNL